MRNRLVLTLSAIALFGSASAALADKHDSLEVRTGFGDEITVKHGWFGTKKTVFKDRLGDQYVKGKGLFGSEDKGVSLLGNGYSKHKGLFGSKETEAHDILGDRIHTKKGLFSSKKTEVDLSGVGSVVQQFASKFMGGGKTGSLPTLPDGSVDARGLQVTPDNSLDAAAGLSDGNQQMAPMQAMPRRY